MELILNESQQAVVDAGLEPMLVIAGPGAGKTTVLAARISRLLNQESRSNRKVLGITYTNVAAKNLREKLIAAVPAFVDRVIVTTFHGFATRVLQQHGSHIGLPPDFAIINENEDRSELLRRAAAAQGMSLGETQLRVEPLLRLLARLYERCIDVEEAREVLTVDGSDHLALALFEPYIQTSIEEEQLEFSLLVQLCNRLLIKHPAIARQMRRVYQYICVDEFQDTNEMQYRLLDILAAEDSSGLVLLADQDQVIYQWNGASPARLAQASDRFHLNLMVLPTSYRCPEAIVRAAARLIALNSSRFTSPAYESDSERSAEIDVLRFVDEDAELKWVAAQIALIPTEDRGAVAVLARNRKLVELALKAAVMQGVSCVAPVAKYDFVSAPLVLLYSVLRLANQPNRQNVTRRLVSAFYVLTGRVVDADVLSAEAEERSADVLTVFFERMVPQSRSDEFRILADVIATKLIARKEFRDVSSALFAWVDSLPPSSLKVAYSEDYVAERETWEELERRHQGMRTEKVTLAEFLRDIGLESKAREPVNAVRFLTVHGAKGLEFTRIFIIGAAEGQFPAFQATRVGTSGEALEEERRSFFVAVTRTFRRLTLTFANNYFGYAASESRFIGEMGLVARDVLHS